MRVTLKHAKNTKNFAKYESTQDGVIVTAYLPLRAHAPEEIVVEVPYPEA